MKLNPYILFSGNAEEAYTLYASVFGGEILQVSRFGDSPMPCDESEKNKIMHARLQFGDNLIMFSDGRKEDASADGYIQLSVEIDSLEAINTIFEKMSEGGIIIMPLQDMFWGARFGMLQDKFGINWMFNHTLQQ
ncbi:VOC family protein [Parasediminibacterium sp. JCM 36343]|uniref:VOC family protein n=1 Tax=Parasediminibacterium sp. JCM 36343 TaxID=3374279 RepID=UPI00397C5E27